MVFPVIACRNAGSIRNVKKLLLNGSVVMILLKLQAEESSGFAAYSSVFLSELSSASDIWATAYSTMDTAESRLSSLISSLSSRTANRARNGLQRRNARARSWHWFWVDRNLSSPHTKYFSPLDREGRLT